MNEKIIGEKILEIARCLRCAMDELELLEKEENAIDVNWLHCFYMYRESLLHIEMSGKRIIDRIIAKEETKPATQKAEERWS